ncbi:MAG: DUF1622 domain-containing protein [Ruegeria sp.]
MIETYREIFERAAQIMEIFAVALIVLAFFKASIEYHSTRRAKGREAAFHRFRGELSGGLLLGLEVLVVADVIDSILIEPSYTSIGLLFVLIVVRTVISWSTTLQAEGRWPWQPELPGAQPDGGKS